jgi:DNA repair protein RadC
MGKSTEANLGPEGHRQRLKERFQKAGRTALADYELLELLLTYVIPRRDTKAVAKALLCEFKTLFDVLHQSDRRLMDIQGIGPHAATFLKVIQACLARCLETEVENYPSISGPEDVFAFIRTQLGTKTTECVYALYLDEVRRLVHHAEILSGTVDRVPLYPREILKPGLIHNATGLILVHNHPHGLPVPSEHDLEMTKKLEEAASPVGIKLLDHVIVARHQAYSLKTGKLL